MHMEKQSHKNITDKPLKFIMDGNYTVTSIHHTASKTYSAYNAFSFNWDLNLIKA